MRETLPYIEEIFDLIALKQEGEYWDFKKEWHRDKADLLHDIICMANNLADKTAYIIIGIDEENDYSISDVTTDPNRKTTQNIVDFLRDKQFAGGIRPKVYVQNINIDRNTIDVITVFNEYSTPFYLTKNYENKVYANNIYTRVMDTNTPKTKSADLHHVEFLWKKRFGLNSTPLERVQLMLAQPENWLVSPVESSMIQFNKYAPEYTIEKVESERDGYEFYLFAQYDKRPFWYDINIKYHQTQIASVGGVGLDGRRFFTATPLSGFICFKGLYNPDKDISYKYFIKDTLEYNLYQFYILQANNVHEAQYANSRYMECILVFESEMEKNYFEVYVREHRKEFDVDLNEQPLPHFPELEGYRMEYFIKAYSNALILQELLMDFRKSN